VLQPDIYMGGRDTKMLKIAEPGFDV